ncbi:tetratricopeptide repeat protein [bacterium]|jgi:tetratricopeptide (TPR) repeat protein|nr:tetratricopeptide repeat protein [bacterium]
MTDSLKSSADLFQRALKLHQGGNLSKAHDIYHQYLSQSPGDPKGWYFSGAVAFELGDLLGASNSFRRATDLDPTNAVFRFNLAIALFKLGRYQESEEETRSVLALKSDYPRAWNLLGVFQMKNEEFPVARESFQKASLLAPELVEAKINLGKALIKLMEFTLADVELKKAAALDSSHSGLELARGDLCLRTGKPTEALAHYEVERGKNPNQADLWNQMGLAHLELAQRTECRKCLEKALDLDPGNEQTLNNLGLCLQQMGKYHEAIEAYKLATTRDQSYADPHNNLGSLFLSQGENQKAKKAIRHALALNPEFWEAWINLGNYHREEAEYDEAINCYQRVLDVNPSSPSAIWNLSLLQLLRGEYLAGFKGFEARAQIPGLKLREYPGEARSWDGGECSQGSLLVFADQGFGDTLQFCRFLPLARKLVKELWFQCHPSLVELLKSFCEDKIISIDENPPPIDFQAALSSLPHLLGTELESIPEGPNLYHSDIEEIPEAVHKALESNVKTFRIGICWAGNPMHSRDRIRSLQVEEFEPLFSIPGTSFHSLQVGDSHPPIPDRLKEHVNDLSGSLQSFMKTAQIIHRMDLVLSVDTAVAHLAGSLGKPTWVLLPQVPDWRWMLDRVDSPWYPSMRLFRQNKSGDWKPVFMAVRTVLREILGKGQ